MTVLHNNTVKEGGEAQISGSWGRFARKWNFNPGYCKENRTNDSIWFYAAISALYFFLIGVVLLILLLAPKYKPVHQAHLDISSASSIQETILAPELDDESEVAVTQNSSQELPKDPLYDIDPRSPIFRGNMHQWKNDPEDEEKVRINDKFLYD